MSVQPLETRHRVYGFDCGYGGPFRPLSLVNFFQEAAGDHASLLGVGMQEMFAAGRTWMLSRIDIEVARLPQTGEEVSVRTWPSGTERLFALRHICLFSAAGELLAGARYDYLVVDLERRRPLRPERILDPGMVAEVSPPFPDLAPGTAELFAAAPEELARRGPSFVVKASPRHIDHNGHVNNAHLVDWLCDAPPLDARGSGALSRLKVDFIAEVRLGEELAAVSWKEGEWTASALLRGGEPVAKAAIRWAPD